MNKTTNRPSLPLGLLNMVIALIMISPLVFMASASLKFNADIYLKPFQLISDKINWNNYQVVLSHPNFLNWYANSFLVVICVILMKLIIVPMAAYAFAKLRFRGREILFLFLLSGMMITGDSTVISRYLLYQQIGLLDTLGAIIIPAAFDVYFLFLLRQFFKSIPDELTEAALIDGASHVRIYVRMMLPLAMSPVITMFLFSFIWIWNDFVSPFIFITDIKNQLLSVGLQYFQGERGNDMGVQMAGACLAIVPVIFLFTLVQKYFVQGIANTGLK